MRKISWLATAVLLATTAGCQGNQSPERPAPDRAALLAVVDSFNAAFATEDSARLGRTLSDDSSFVFFGTGAGEIQLGRNAFLEKHQTQDWAEIDNASFSAPTELHIQASPTLAVMMYETVLSFSADGQPGSLPLRMVLTLVPEQGGWKIRQGLASQIPGEP